MYNNIYDLSVDCSDCQRCALSAIVREEYICPGRGVNKASLMLIGYQPEDTDSKYGLTYTGVEGLLLDKMLASINLTKNDYYLTTVLKCRPLKDGLETKEQITTCSNWLIQQIELVNPIIIVMFGGEVFNAIFNKKCKITQDRGKWYQKDGRLYLLTYSLKFLIKNPSLEQGKPRYMSWLDMMELSKVLSGETPTAIAEVKTSKLPKKSKKKTIAEILAAKMLEQQSEEQQIINIDLNPF